MRKRYVDKDIYISIFMYLLTAVMLFQTKKLPFDSAWFPYITLSVFTLLNTSLLFGSIKKSKEMYENKQSDMNSEKGTSDSHVTSSQDVDIINLKDLKKVLSVLVILIIYVVLFKYTNYFVATSLMLISMMIFNKIRSWKMTIFITIIFNIFIYLFFVLQLKVPLLNM